MFERGTPGRAFHHASTMAIERQTKSTASATTMPSRTVGWSMNPMAAPESPRATTIAATAATTTGTRKIAPTTRRPVRN